MVQPYDHIPEIHYRLPWRSRLPQPGRHPGHRLGHGQDFHGHLPLGRGTDARKIDLRASLHDPWGGFLVRSYRQQSAVPVQLLADLSASLGFGGKMRALRELAVSLAWSTWRSGDPFGFIGCDAAVRPELHQPLRWSRIGAAEIGARLEGYTPRGKSSAGLLDAHALIGRHRALVFWCSDFHLPEAFIEAVLDTLALHQVVPVVLWESAEFEGLPDWRLASLRDPETGARRFLLLRPSLRARLAESRRSRRALLENLFRQRGLEPFFLMDRFDAEALTAHFHHVAETGA